MESAVLGFICVIALQKEHYAAGLQCYTCSITVGKGETDPDLTCVNKPEDVPGRPITTCPTRMIYCTIFRVDMTDTGKISSLTRGCSEKPAILNDDIQDPMHITHYRACTTDLCNKGDGKSYAPGSVDGNGNGIGAIIVKDKDSATSVSVNISILILFSLVFMFQLNNAILT